MTDTRTLEQRRKIMQAVRGKNTKPELVLRRLLHSLGYRFRLHRKDLPGTPDLVFPSRKKVIFVHGCFWHGHECKKGNLPRSNLDYWAPKIARNQERDRKKEEQLRELGWSVLPVWQCEMKELDSLQKRLTEFLDAPGRLVFPTQPR